MARMHSRKKGKSGSTRPSKPALQGWVRYKPKEVELLIVKLSKEGKSASQIGLHLRDTYGIPDVKQITKKSITQILKDKKIAPELPEDLTALLRSVLALQKHLEANKKDLIAKRGLNLTESKVKRLVKYYKNNQMLAMTWKYDPKNVSLLVE